MKLCRVIDHALDIVFRYVDIIDWKIFQLFNPQEPAGPSRVNTECCLCHNVKLSKVNASWH